MATTPQSFSDYYQVAKTIKNIIRHGTLFNSGHFDGFSVKMSNHKVTPHLVEHCLDDHFHVKVPPQMIAVQRGEPTSP